VIGNNRIMDVLTLPIDALDLAALPQGAKQHLALTVASDIGGPLSLPALLVKGTTPGPTLVAVAGVHGNEYEGMEAIRTAFAALDPADLRGTFFAIPVANPLAFTARTRATPAAIDGLNLARVFPGSATGTVTPRLAHHLLALVERHVGSDDLFIDFHSGSEDVAFATLVGYRDVFSPAQQRSEEAARHFGLPLLWRIPDSAGPFNAETARRGIPTIGTETTGRAGFDHAGYLAFVTGLHNVLAFLGMTTDQFPPRFSGPARSTLDVVAREGGFFRPSAASHDEVRAGDQLGTTINIHGAIVDEVTTPVSGTIWARRETPAVRPGEMIAMIALAPTGEYEDGAHV
jgi:predicted deacylase